ncbi:MAG: PAS domain-containing protein [Mariprofundus sp.]
MRINEPVSNHEVNYSERDLLVSKTDTKGKITYCNAAFLRIAGFEESEMLGKPHNIVRHPDMPAAAFQDLWDTVRAGREWNGFVKNRCKNGDHYWVDATVTPSFDNQHNIIGYMSVRRLPSRQQVQESEALYAQMRKAGQ